MPQQPPPRRNSYLDTIEDRVQLSWKRCAEWLTRCQVLPPNHRLLLDSTCTAIDLITLLRDGVLLCHLLPVLSNARFDLKKMKDFNPRPLQCQFLCLRNIRLFLAQCESLFGLSMEQMFDAADLYEMRNLIRVIGCLSQLSRCPSVASMTASLHIEGFILESESAQENEYYNAIELASLLQSDEAAINDVENRSGRGVDRRVDVEDHYDMVEDESEKIYATVVMRRSSDTNKATVVTPGLPKTARDMCIKEILETEKNYVDVLKMLLDEFKKPLLSVLSHDEATQIFYRIEDLRDIHVDFYRDLKLAIESSVRKWRLHEVFIQAKSKFLIYGDYCGHMQLAQKSVENLTKHEHTEKAQAIAKCQRVASSCKFKLTHLLAVPMQRVLKYHLLIDTLMKHSKKPPEDEDLEGLRQAHIEMTDLGKYINEVKKDYDLIASIDEIQASISDLQMPPNVPKLSDYGRLLKDGELRVIEQLVSNLPMSRSSNRQCTPKTRYVFLFDKVVMLCKGRAVGDAYSYKDAFQLSQYRLSESTDSAASVGLDEGMFRRHNLEKFSFMLVKNDTGRCFTFTTKNEATRNQWISALRLAFDNIRPAHYADNNCFFEMTSFKRPTKCTVCNRLLYGVFFQGYRCLRSNLTVHKSCISEAVNQLTVSSSSKLSLPPRPPARSSYLDGLGHQSVNLLFRSNSTNHMNVTSSGSLCQVVLPYHGKPPPPADMTALLLQEGDKLEIIKGDSSQVWWQGKQICSGAVGWFPANCIASVPIATADSVDSNEDESLIDHAWYVGRMTRDEAANCLAPYPELTFLVRLSVQRNGEFCISMKYRGTTKHMKIERSAGDNGMWFLSSARCFLTIAELVDYYSHNSLGESFAALHDVTFGMPLKEATVARETMIDRMATSSSSSTSQFNVANNDENEKK